ncbi:EAL domain-containing protein [Primorskyibacter flagellatus]|uniref:EAL domain, c-di-GMP-specific phosphodiesterase class I (Or its enzymatically inactive variant) n=1 Tax=Primorskyibacter flagellatus TaxID=1387277 RepID=A0A1W2AY91_9RHOB|nr:EAL domain-containing protein [Primorskyibacter flagellatus]SMC65679.1 EAL domain, c-di-GMP-specific phosphodiesterase class I (or its enzymatically inactive variant) [Primorskyibacter flagellatus]
MGLQRKAALNEQPRNALTLAIEQRDANTIKMVEAAVRHRQVLLAFQPVVQARDPRRTAFYEGLIRVLDETGRVIPAKDFINVVEETETGRLLDCIALEKGLRALETQPTLRLSINMSARSIGYKKWLRVLQRGLARNPTVGERLILEITENSAMLVPELVVGFMQDLQHKGISFALDDFGAGYTAFRHFKDFQFDILKIDGQFITDIARDADNQVLTRAMVSVAQQFDMFTVAERVERAEDAAFLQDLGVDCLQGYFYGSPTVCPPWEKDALQRASA